MDAAVGRVGRVVLQRCLDDLLASEPGVVGALVCTSDGFEVAAALPAGYSPATLAAMASSQLALSDALCREASLGGCRNLVVDAEIGKVLVMEIPGSERQLLLGCIGGARHTLGQVLYACKASAEDIGRRLVEARGG